MGNTPSAPGGYVFDPSQNLKVTGGGGAAPINLTQVNGNPLALSNPVPVELSDGTNPFGTATNPLTVSTKKELTGSAPTAATVGVASGLAVALNANRKSLILVNISTNNISLGFGANPAVLNSGITLLPGGVFNMDEYSFTTAAINAIAAGASSNLAIQEFA